MEDIFISELISGAINGFTGSQGEIGFVGSQGDIGFVGSQGETGYTGSAGNKNVDGGSSSSVYLPTQLLNGGSANG